MPDQKPKDWTADANDLVERLKAFIGLGQGDPLAPKGPVVPPGPQDTSYIAREAAEAARRMNAQKAAAGIAPPMTPAVKALSKLPKKDSDYWGKQLQSAQGDVDHWSGRERAVQGWQGGFLSPEEVAATSKYRTQAEKKLHRLKRQAELEEKLFNTFKTPGTTVRIER